MSELVGESTKGTPYQEIQDIGLMLDTTLHTHYRLTKYLAIGQTSLLYLAYDSDSKKEVVIKEFCPYSFANRDMDRKTVICKRDAYKKQFRKMKEAFKQECQILEQLNHLKQSERIHIVAYQDSFEENDTWYLVMEYVQGMDLEEAIEKSQAPPFKETVRQIISMVRSVHKAGILHLDLKPSNILINEKKELVLIDFGTARFQSQEADELSFATKGYSAPELFLNQSVSEATDMYSIGAMVYYFATGIVPVSAKERLCEDHLQAISSQVNMPGLMEHYVMKCLSLEPNRRPKSLRMLYTLFL